MISSTTVACRWCVEHNVFATFVLLIAHSVEGTFVLVVFVWVLSVITHILEMCFEMKIYNSEVSVDLPLGKGCSSCFAALVNYRTLLWISATFYCVFVCSYVTRLNLFERWPVFQFIAWKTEFIPEITWLWFEEFCWPHKLPVIGHRLHVQCTTCVGYSWLLYSQVFWWTAHKKVC